MVGMTSPDMLCGAECFVGPEVGEGGLPDHVLLYRGGTATIIHASSSDLTSRGLMPYPHLNLTTEHALIVTRALATLHVNTLIRAKSKEKVKVPSTTCSEKIEIAMQSTASITVDSEESGKDDKVKASSSRTVEAGCVKDKWTAQVSRLNIVESNLSIMVDALQSSGSNERTIRRLEALQSDLPTLTQFLQFASAMQTQRIPSVGPVHAGDIWIKEQEEEDEEIVAIRLRGGQELEGPPLRDAAWIWLTLLGGDTLRERYMELCDDYCNAFNKALLHQESTFDVEEISYFDVMRDLGENFLHAFLTIIHKFVVSGNWFFDRHLHTEEGLLALVDVISFLVDNGIVGSIFVI